MTAPYTYNHFIPKFIVNEFSTNNNEKKLIEIYNYRTNELNKYQTNKIFGEDHLYWDENNKDKTEIEKRLNTRIEQAFLPIANKINQSKTNTISLSAYEIDEIKRFFLSEFIRVPSKEIDEVGWERNLKPYVDELTPHNLEDISNRHLQFTYPDKSFKCTSELDEKKQILYDLKVIINNKFKKILDDKNCSVSLATKYRAAEIADVGIWKCDWDNEFILTDSYLISEWDQLTDCEPPITRNGKFLLDLIKKYDGYREIQKRYLKLYIDHGYFPELVWFLPISPKIIIVLINPIFKELYNGNLKNYNKEYYHYSMIDANYFQSIVEREQTSKIIEIQQLNSVSSKYINSLMLDRIQNYFGFKNSYMIVKSIKLYNNAMKPTFNYEPLIEKLEKEIKSKDTNKLI
ncbi:MAG: DUF4238 domain-containing protein [Candidatus Methanogranum gryphiswaldense]|nr:MAG: DUF4238 domain-containing protein [Candidatus Methanogranum sp. U3.2.1]